MSGEMNDIDYYTLLGVQRSSDADEIREAIKRERTKWSGRVPTRGVEARQVLSRINAAEKTLLDPQRRKKYDEELDKAAVGWPERAAQFCAAGMSDLASSAVENAIRDDPRDIEVWKLAADIYFSMRTDGGLDEERDKELIEELDRKLDKAIQQLFAIDPKDPMSYELRGDVALKDYSKEAPSDPYSLLHQGFPIALAGIPYHSCSLTSAAKLYEQMVQTGDIYGDTRMKNVAHAKHAICTAQTFWSRITKAYSRIQSDPIETSRTEITELRASIESHFSGCPDVLDTYTSRWDSIIRIGTCVKGILVKQDYLLYCDELEKSLAREVRERPEREAQRQAEEAQRQAEEAQRQAEEEEARQRAALKRAWNRINFPLLVLVEFCILMSYYDPSSIQASNNRFISYWPIVSIVSICIAVVLDRMDKINDRGGHRNYRTILSVFVVWWALPCFATLYDLLNRYS